jgi:all-trans-retinol dehydrogenase (NAD+)
MKKFNGKVALITGGASGIGRLVAEKLASRGARVVVWDLNPAAIETLERESAAALLAITGMVCDVTDREAVYRLAREVETTVGPVDILVNNAGVVSGKTLLETPDEKIAKTMDVNILASCWTVKAFLPGMLERNSGHLVTIASAAGLVGVTGLADYSASKFAAFGFHEAVRMEIRRQRKKIGSTVVCPFFIDTGMFAGVRTRFPLLLPILKPEYAARRIAGAIARGRKRLIMPRFVYSVFLLRLLPVGMMDAVADFFGMTRAMDHFTGRQ